MNAVVVRHPSPEVGPSQNRGAAVTFFALAYGLSWAWVIPLAVSGQEVVQGRPWPTHLPSLLGPMLAAVILCAITGRTAVRDLARRTLRWRIGWRWWLVAISPTLFLLTWLAGTAAVGAALPQWNDFAQFSGVSSSLGPLGVAAVIIIVNGFGEEVGWRGYALPRLQQHRGPVSASLLLSAAWAGWHIPQFFVLHSYRNFPLAMIPVFVLGLCCGAIVLTWLYNRTGGSLLAVAVWHGAYNAAGATAAAEGALAAAVWTFVVMTAVIVLAYEWRARRRGRDSVMHPAGLG